MATNPWGRVAGLVLGVTALLSLVLLAFAWPTSEIEPRDLPIAAAGPEEMLAGLEQEADDALDLSRVGSREEALELIEDRDAYGAILADEGGTELLLASGASPTVAGFLREMVTEHAAEQAPAQGPGQAPAPTVTEVVPLPEGDPRGAVFSSGSLPLVLGGIITAALISVLVRDRSAVLATITGVAVLSGLALAGLLQGVFDALGGRYSANAAVLTLGLAAMATTIVGLKSWLGAPGIGIGALLMMLVGNPLSGITSAPELLPLGWLGQLLPPGAMGSALRSTAYFDGAGVAGPVVVLLAWAGLGVALVLTAKSGKTVEQPVLENA